MTLSDAEITQMRSDLEALALPGTAILYSRAGTADGYGTRTETYTAAATVACHISPLEAPREAEPATGSRITPDVDRVVTLPANTTITTEYRAEIAGTTYDVTSVRAPRSFEVSRRVEVSEAH